jgi:AAA+ ATPase superfamily predicted ATPase
MAAQHFAGPVLCATLVDRDDERRELSALLATGSPRLALLTGRRRIGKTYLLTHTWSPDRFFLFTATRTTADVNRVQLLLDFSRWSGEDIRVEDYPTWRTVFNLLLDFRTPEPLVVALDEFQYLAEDETGVGGLASELNAALERRRALRPILLVLAGSAVGTMEALAAGGGPLYGRFAWQHRLRPFSYWHAGELAGLVDLRERALAYGIFGGTPRYLAALDPNIGLIENVQHLLLAPRGEVRLLVETAIEQEEGLRDVAKYRAVLRAVAGGATKRNEIAQRAGLPNDNALRDKLVRLIELGYIERWQNIDAKSNDAVRYGIADPCFRFHQRFVEPNTSVLERYDPAHVWAENVEPHLDAYMGREFERIANQAYDRRRVALGLPMVQHWGRWDGVDRARRSLEIDIVAPLTTGGTMTGTVKWARDPVSADLHFRHLDMLQRAADSGRRWAHEAIKPAAPLFFLAAGGFTRGFHEAAEASGHPLIAWCLKDLYQE